MRQITIPKQLIISENYNDFLDAIKKIISDFAKHKVIIFTGASSKKIIGNQLIKDILSARELQNFSISSSFVINDMQAPSDIDTNSLLIAIGGGKVLDQVKLLAAKNNSKFISIPTLISHDGICSPVAVINGKSYGAIMPSALVVPLFIIKEASIEQIQSGVGDLIANLSAVEDWKLANKFNNEAIDDFAIMLSKQAAMTVISLLESKQAEAKTFSLKEDFFLRSLIEALTISGIAMSIAGNSRPCSGAEHMISHAIDEIYGPGIKASHGIQVLVATLFMENIRGYDLIESIFADAKEINFNLQNFNLDSINYSSKLYKILSEFNFPTRFDQIGINQQELLRVLRLAPQTRKNRFTAFDLIARSKDAELILGEK